MQALEAIQHAREVRNRLRFPSNAKPDLGIDLKRKPPVVIPPPPVPIADAAFGPKHDPDDSFGPKLPCQLPATGATILRAVSERFGISRAELTGGRRQAELTYPRHIVMYLCQTLTGRSFPEIGQMLGGRNHATVIHGVRAIHGRLCAGDPATIEHVDALAAKFAVRE